jgi:hypothetical protein
MKQLHKVYLPKWQRWFLIPLFVLIWGMIAYLQFGDTTAADKLPWPAFAIMTIVFLGLSIMFWFMTSGKLPAYMIELNDEDKNDPNKSKI